MNILSKLLVCFSTSQALLIFGLLYALIKNSNIYLEELFTHMYDAMNKNIVNKQYEKFENITSDINYNNIEIIHLCASDATLQNKKRDYEKYKSKFL